MADILKGLTGTASVFLFAWILPAVIAVGVFTFLLVPSLTYWPSGWDVAKADWGKLALLLAFISVIIALLMSGLQLRLYRLLEGYSWHPRQLRERGVRKERERKAKIQSELSKLAEEPAPSVGWEEALLAERLGRFPIDDNDTAPSRLGNALHSFETYGWNRFCLDSQTLWTELVSVAPDALQKDLDQARAVVDFFVCLVYLTLVLGIAALTGLIGREDFGLNLFLHNWQLLAAGLGAFVLARIWYGAAVTSSSYWYSTVQALVNICRLDLAKKMGFQIPDTLEEERKMWRAVSDLVAYPYDKADLKGINRYKLR